MTDAPKCEKCGEPAVETSFGVSCSHRPESCTRITELKRELTKHHRASVKHVAELQSQRYAALKARDEAADQVVVLMEALEELIEVADLRGDSDLPHPSDDPKLWTARMIDAWDDGRDALSNTSALAAQRKREIQMEALELPSRVPPPGCERGWMINQNMPDTLKVGWSSDHTIPPGTIEFWQDGKLKGRIDGIGIHAVFGERVKP